MRNLILGALVRSGDFVSGEEISRLTGISRAAVWKHMETLKKEGYDIESVTKKGYKLIDGDAHPETVFFRLPAECVIGREYVYLDEVESTNTLARSKAGSMPDGSVIIADRQISGRGRMGRHWDSAGGKGIWMSVILKPAIRTAEAMVMTHMAGAAVCDALCRCGFQALIKWPNDIVMNGRKVCGILAMLEGEPDMLHHVIIGIGVNVSHAEEDFPQELLDKATSLRIEAKQPVDRNMILENIIERLDFYYKCLERRDTGVIMDFCRQKSATLGREVRIIEPDGELRGKAVALTDKGGLVIEDDQGRATEIISGEVSVRGIYDYV